MTSFALTPYRTPSPSITAPFKTMQSKQKSRWSWLQPSSTSRIKAVAVIALLFFANLGTGSATPSLSLKHAVVTSTPLTTRPTGEQISSLMCSTTRDPFHPICEMDQFGPFHMLSLDSRASIYQKRYPELFNAFLRHTNEKQRTIERIELSLPTILSTLSSGQKNEEIRIIDLGFGTGELTSFLAASVHKLLDPSAHVHVLGIEKQQKFVANAHELFARRFSTASIDEDFRQGDFFNDKLPEDFRNQAQIILASHAFYDHPNKKELSAKIATLTHPKGAVGIYIHENSSQIDAFISQHEDILHARVKEDSNPSIEQSLRESEPAISYTTDTFEHEVQFPKLDEAEWQRLKEVEYFNFENTYSNESAEWHDAKRMMEFFFQQPLEGIYPPDLSRLIDGFKDLLARNNDRVTMQNQVFFVNF